MRALVLLLPVALLVAVAAPPAAGSPAKDAALLKAIKAQRLSRVEFKENDLQSVLKWLRVATGRNFHLKIGALAKAGIDWESIRYTVSFDDVTVAALLEVLLDPHEMAWVVKDNIVFVTSKADSYGKPFTRMYAIAHITWQKIDFIAPEINLNPSGFVGEDYEPEVLVENDPLATGDAVAEVLKEIVLPEAWSANDDWTIRATDTYLVIRAPKSVHDLVPGALDKIAAMK
jgi:hypothetical protein